MTYRYPSAVVLFAQHHKIDPKRNTQKQLFLRWPHYNPQSCCFQRIIFVGYIGPQGKIVFGFCCAFCAIPGLFLRLFGNLSDSVKPDYFARLSHRLDPGRNEQRLGENTQPASGFGLPGGILAYTVLSFPAAGQNLARSFSLAFSPSWPYTAWHIRTGMLTGI